MRYIASSFYLPFLNSEHSVQNSIWHKILEKQTWLVPEFPYLVARPGTNQILVRSRPCF